MNEGRRFCLRVRGSTAVPQLLYPEAWTQSGFFLQEKATSNDGQKWLHEL
jgi:hypothetical protein